MPLAFRWQKSPSLAGNEKTLKLLLDKGVSPIFKVRPLAGSLLHAAAVLQPDQHRTIAYPAPRQGWTLPTNFGFTPFHVSAFRGSVEVLEMLLKHKADCNQGTASAKFVPPFGGAGPEARQLAAVGNTALHLAALTGQTNVLVVCC